MASVKSWLLFIFNRNVQVTIATLTVMLYITVKRISITCYLQKPQAVSSVNLVSSPYLMRKFEATLELNLEKVHNTAICSAFASLCGILINFGTFRSENWITTFGHVWTKHDTMNRVDSGVSIIQIYINTLQMKKKLMQSPPIELGRCCLRFFFLSPKLGITLGS